MDRFIKWLILNNKGYYFDYTEGTRNYKIWFYRKGQFPPSQRIFCYVVKGSLMVHRAITADRYSKRSIGCIADSKLFKVINEELMKEE